MPSSSRAAKRKSRTIEDSSDDSDAPPPSKKSKQNPKPSDSNARKRRAPDVVITSRAIPRTYDECSDADKMLIDMRDEGKGWTEIRAAYEEMTGEKNAQSTLPNRYLRLKTNFSVIKEEDMVKLMQAKKQVDATFEEEKWSLINDAVIEAGGDDYGAEVLRLNYRKLMLNAGAAPPPGIRDADLDGEGEGEGDDDEE